LFVCFISLQSFAQVPTLSLNIYQLLMQQIYLYRERCQHWRLCRKTLFSIKSAAEENNLIFKGAHILVSFYFPSPTYSTHLSLSHSFSSVFRLFLSYSPSSISYFICSHILILNYHSSLRFQHPSSSLSCFLQLSSIPHQSYTSFFFLLLYVILLSCFFVIPSPFFHFYSVFLTIFPLFNYTPPSIFHLPFLFLNFFVLSFVPLLFLSFPFLFFSPFFFPPLNLF